MEFSSTIQNLYYIIQNLYVCKGIVTNMEVSFYKHIFYTVGFLMSTLCHLIEQQSQRAFVNRYNTLELALYLGDWRKKLLDAISTYGCLIVIKMA